MIKVSDLLAEDEILKEYGATIACPQTFLVPDVAANVRGQEPLRVVNFIFGQMITRDSLRSSS